MNALNLPLITQEGVGLDHHSSPDPTFLAVAFLSSLKGLISWLRGSPVSQCLLSGWQLCLYHVSASSRLQLIDPRWALEAEASPHCMLWVF